jgi:3',5'-cyclic AMP phosphodiesterase CpdA
MENSRMKIWISVLLSLLNVVFCVSGPATADDVAETDQPLFSFGIVADVQYCDADAAGRRFYRNSLKKLRECVQDLNSHDLEFTIQLGDFIDRDMDSFDRVVPIFRSLESSAYHVLGNHDFSVADDQKREVLGRLGMKRKYYDFALKGWRFVVLDGNDLSLHATEPGSASRDTAVAMHKRLRSRGAANAHDWNGAVGQKQLAWLEDRLEAADGAGEKVVLFCHFPVFPEDAHNLWNAGKIVELLASHPSAVAYLAGHNHAGNYGQRDRVHYLTLQGMVDTPDENAYAVVEVYDDRLEIRGVGRVPSRTLALREKR